jgi:Fe2+ transport system protein FeoA
MSQSTKEINMGISLPETRLNKLPPRTCAIVCRIETESEDMQRLKMLGICVGRRVEVVKPGDPLIVRVFGTRLGMSASLASHIWLEVCPPGRCAILK